MNELLAMLLNLFRNQPDSEFLEVYASFDMLPVSSKSKKLFLVISPETFRMSQAFPDGNSGISPFTADFRFSLLSSMNTPHEKLLEYFYSVLVPKLHDSNCFLCEMQSDSPKIDLKLQKLVYSGLFRLKGLYIPEQEVLP
ncbi:MAG: hypothetical protein IKI37_01890 [Oscillospiraceae bacterium]|nr:hypothetical protein [Oscillospiraceae bacterium]MBR7083918.1 hypothetical protein [Oscillospiraceae bacterium]